MHTTSSRARPVEFMSADARHVIASSQAGPWGPSRPFPGRPGRRKIAMYTECGLIPCQYQSYINPSRSFGFGLIWIDRNPILYCYGKQTTPGRCALSQSPSKSMAHANHTMRCALDYYPNVGPSDRRAYASAPLGLYKTLPIIQYELFVLSAHTIPRTLLN